MSGKDVTETVLSGNWYLKTTGMIIIETTVDGENKVLTYYRKEVLEDLKNKYNEIKETNPDYALSMKKFLETTYTNSTGGNGEILVCTFNNTLKTIEYKYNDNQIIGKEEETGQAEMSYSVVNYDVVATKYGTPVEFLMNLLEITGSSDFVNAFIAEVTKKTYYIKLGLYDMTVKTTSVEQISYVQTTAVKGEINTGIKYTVRDNGIIETNNTLTMNSFNTDSYLLNNNEPPELGPIVEHTETPSETPGKINISAAGQFHTGGHTYTLYCNDKAIGSYVLSTTSYDVATWNDLDAPTNNEYAVSKLTEGNVTETITSIDTANGYDLGIKEVKCWWAEIKMENKETTNTEYLNLNQENLDSNTVDQFLTGLGDSTETILENVQGEAITKEPEEYTKTENPKIFRESSLTVTNSGKEGFLNSIYNYIVNDESIIEKYSRIEKNSHIIQPYAATEQMIIKGELDSRGITKDRYDYNSILLTFRNALQKVSTVKQDKEVTYGVPTGDYSIDGVLALLRNNKGEPVEYADLYESETRAGEMLVNGAEMLFQLLDSSENTEGLSEVMRYILYKYSGKDYGVTKFNFGLIGDISLNGTTPVILGNTIQDKVWFGLKSLGYSDISIAAAMGNIHYESENFDPNYVETGYNENNGGIGICQWTNDDRGPEGRNTQLKTFASKRETVWQDSDIQVEFLMAELTGSGADGCADYQLMNTDYTGTTYNYSEWENAQDSETLDQAKLKRLTEVFMFTFERPNTTAGRDSLDKRYNHALYYYNMYHGKSLSGGTEGGADTSNGIIARFTSNITGKTFTVWSQDDVGLKGKCNRSIAATIASGYRKEGEAETSVLTTVKAGGGDILSNATNTKNYFDQYGLQAQIDSYTYSTVNIKNLLTSGKYVCIWFDTRGTGKEGYGKSGSQYCGKNGIHWVAIIGYNYNNGDEKIYIAEPYGFDTGTGWHDLDELDPMKGYIGHFTVVSEK